MSLPTDEMVGAAHHAWHHSQAHGLDLVREMLTAALVVEVFEEPHDPVQKMAYWSRRILEGDAETAGGSMDLDYSHDELTKAAKEYLA